MWLIKLIREMQIHHYFLTLSSNRLISPLSPNSDLSQISHCNIKGLSVREVMRAENMITQVKLTAYSHYFCKNCLVKRKDNFLTVLRYLG